MSGWVKCVGEVVRVGGVVCLGRVDMLAWAVLCVWVGEGDQGGGKWCYGDRVMVLYMSSVI